MKNKNLFLSIILPTYNRLYSLKRLLLPSLEKQDFNDYELIVVDDGSSDGTSRYFNKQFKVDYPKLYRKTKYFRNNKNIGAPASRNKGSSKALGKWFFITEDDIEIGDINFLSKATKMLHLLPKDVAVFSPKRNESNIIGYYKNPYKQFAKIGKLSGEIYIDPAQEYSGFVPTTHATSFIRCDIYNTYLEDEKVFYGSTFRDESDLYLRIVKAGYRISYAGDKLALTHRNDIVLTGGQKKIKSLSLFNQELMLIRNHYRFLHKNYSLAKIRTVFFIFIRLLKHISNITHEFWIKKFMAKYAI